MYCLSQVGRGVLEELTVIFGTDIGNMFKFIITEVDRKLFELSICVLVDENIFAFCLIYYIVVNVTNVIGLSF